MPTWQTALSPSSSTKEAACVSGAEGKVSPGVLSQAVASRSRIARSIAAPHTSCG